MLTLKLTLSSDTGLSISRSIPGYDVKVDTVSDAIEELVNEMSIAYRQQEELQLNGGVYSKTHPKPLCDDLPGSY